MTSSMNGTSTNRGMPGTSPLRIFVQGCSARQLQHDTGIQGVFGADVQPVPVEDLGAAGAVEQ